jgi:tetratricopeptide (TPR) repeat protein
VFRDKISAVASSGPKQVYLREDVRRILKIPEIRLRSWERNGFVESRSEFTFRDLIALKTLKELRDKRIPPQRIKRALHSLMQKLDGVRQPLTELKIVSDGRTIAVDLGDGKMEALTGQLLFDFDTASLAEVKPLPRREASRSREALERESEGWFQVGLELEESGADPADILRAYARALELNPNAAGACVNMGTVYYQIRNLSEAERCYRRAVEMDPGYPLAHFNLANICDEQGRLDEARRHYLTALRLRPDYADAHYNLALLFERTGEPMQAVKHWRAYLKIDPASPWAGIARQQLQSLLSITLGGRRASPASPTDISLQS